MYSQAQISLGESYPLGATPDRRGVNFAIFSANAEKIELCLFNADNDSETQRIPLNVDGDIWHVHIGDLPIGAHYAYRVYGPYEPHKGHRFNPHKIVLDPYARALSRDFQWSHTVFAYNTDAPEHDLVCDTQDNAADMPKCVVLDDQALLNTGSTKASKPHIPWQQSVIYETHVKGFTQRHLSVPGDLRGTIAGLRQPDVLHYIKDLGVTAIELLPVQGFIDELFLEKNGLSNYWGYNSLNFFMPHRAYLASGQREEFKDFVDAAHALDIEVILDVVYNHTAEGNHLGPSLSFRGIDNASYYVLASHDARFYVNDTGCGNTLNLRHPRVLQMVMDSLRFWAGTMGVDGFRFDLATVMGREDKGFNPNAAFFQSLKQDPILARCKLIAEPWDIGPGGYQLGAYPPGWSEWNDRYRDTVRRFWRGDLGMLPEVARRVHGSSDIFEHSGRGPSASINFVCSHDGFTLQDLVSYNKRNNLANKENNKDGHQANFSDNHGEEGPSDNAGVNTLRLRQKRNILATLFLSQGTPMLLAGDELGRSQHGNNNAYCQDTELNWVDWQAISKDDQVLQAFTRYLIQLRRQYPLLTSKRYIHRPDEPEEKGASSVRWYNADGEEMHEEQWSEQHVHCLGWLLEKNCFETVGEHAKSTLLIMFNAGDDNIEFCLPKVPHVTQWQELVNTASHQGYSEGVHFSLGQSVQLMAKSMCLLLGEFE